MEDRRYVQFKCYFHELPLDGTWQCPERGCRAAHCPLCGRYEKDRCEHLLFTQGEWVYYAVDGLNSEEFPGGGFEEQELDLVVEACDGDNELARRLWEGGDPLRVLLELAVERIQGPVLVAHAGGWSPGSDSWSNTWVGEPSEALSALAPLIQRYHAARAWLEERDERNEEMDAEG